MHGTIELFIQSVISRMMRHAFEVWFDQVYLFEALEEYATENGEDMPTEEEFLEGFEYWCQDNDSYLFKPDNLWWWCE